MSKVVKWLNDIGLYTQTQYENWLESCEAMRSRYLNCVEEKNRKVGDKNRMIENLNNTLTTCEKKRRELSNKLNRRNKEEELEHYWNNKRKKSNVVHPARPLIYPDGTIKSTLYIDPRIFYQEHDHTLPGLKYVRKNDSKALAALNLVTSMVKYKGERKEFWQLAKETMERGAGDCEDGAILMVNIMLKAGVPYWRVRLNAGDVKGGGHAYVTYLREEDDKWYVLDWCYWNSLSKNFGLTWEDAEDRYFGIWFSCNKYYCYGEGVNLDRQ